MNNDTDRFFSLSIEVLKIQNENPSLLESDQLEAYKQLYHPFTLTPEVADDHGDKKYHDCEVYIH